MSMQVECLPSERSAHVVTVTGWACAKCNRWYAQDERTARYCCATDFPCPENGCKNRAPKGHIRCDDCDEARQRTRWEALPENEWDEQTPLVLDGDDTYFFNADDLRNWIEDEDGRRIDDARLVVCVPEAPPTFEMAEFLTDYLPPDMDGDLGDTSKIDDRVNGWIRKNAPKAWVPGTTRPTLTSLREALGEEATQ